MALPATDNFTGTDEDTITEYSANWTSTADWGEAIINSNRLDQPDSLGNFAAHWTADSFDNDQYSEADFYLSGNYRYFGVTVRESGDAAAVVDHYFINSAANDGPNMGKVVNGSETTLSSSGSIPGSGERVTIEANGTTIRWLLDDSQQASATDSSLATGSAGVNGWGQTLNAAIDNWEGGNLGGAAQSVVPLVMHHFRQQGIT